MKAMIFAAGLGTRMRPFTDIHPKALVMVGGKTLLQRNIEYLASYQITELIINVHHFPGQIIRLLSDRQGFGSSITISDESDELVDTGGGLKKAAWFFEGSLEPFVVINCDILTDMNLGAMIGQHKKYQPEATLAVSSRSSTRNFLFDGDGLLCGWSNSGTGEKKMSREVKNYSPMAFSGIHVISPSIFSLSRMEGKFSMVDWYLELAARYPIQAFDHTGARFIDVGRPESVAKAEEDFKEK
jgi:MurNAc alpha-1-phosphate uridylyltransferase